MTEANYNLAQLRGRFDREVASRALSPAIILRYQSWVRRFIQYCRSAGLPLTSDSARSFLQDYDSASTRRQGYYALKFLFTKVMQYSAFFSLQEADPSLVYINRIRRKWWNWCH